jgi:drug/metabolite transporter (DMT)-like permease
MTQASLSARAWLDMVLLATIWGASFLSIKIGLGELPVLTLVAHRVVWAALVLWAYVLWRRFALPRDWRVWGAFLVMGVLNNAIPFGLMAWGQQFIETGLTSIYNAATAVFAVLVAAAVFADERLTVRRGVGVVLAFAASRCRSGWMRWQASTSGQWRSWRCWGVRCPMPSPPHGRGRSCRGCGQRWRRWGC